MAELHVAVEGSVGAPPARVYALLADYRAHHPRILPPAFREFRLEEGGVGAGTVFFVRVRTGGASRAYRMRVDEPAPGRVLRETAIGADLVTTFTVDPDGDRSRVRIATTWQPARGPIGLLERLFAPRAMRRLYADELARLDRYARQQPQQ